MGRIIGEYIGEEKGPLVICIGGIHGNETAGLKALDLVLKMLEVEPIANPGFSFNGKFVALQGNIPAIKRGKRYIDRDLNRIFIPSRIQSFLDKSASPQYSEDLQALEIIAEVNRQIKEYKPDQLIILDLHTTSSPGGIFTIVRDEHETIQIAKEMHAPIVKGFIEGIQGTTLHYFTEESLKTKVHTITFESGQHQSPNSVPVAIAAIVACLRAIGCVKADDVENQHDKILIDYSRNLPAFTELIKKHNISEEDRFKMEPNYLNFQKVRKGEVIAHDKNGPITVEEDGLILMPLYQDQGEDGFFIIKSITENEFHK